MQISCLRCGVPVRSENPYCPNCGLALSATQNTTKWKPVLGIIAVIVGLLWVATSFISPVPTTLPASQLSTAPVSAPQVLLPTPVSRTTTLTPAQHLAEARRALGDPAQSSKKVSPTQLAAARWHLEAISKGIPEYKEAQTLLADVTKRERIALKPSPTPELREEAVALGEDAEYDGTEIEATDDYAPTPAKRQTSFTHSAPSSTDRSVENNAPDYSDTPAEPRGTSGRGYYTNRDGTQVRSPTHSSSVPSGASAQCRDGSYSFSRNRRGTCSHHGGVARWF